MSKATIQQAVQDTADIPLIRELISLHDKSSPSYNKILNSLLKPDYTCSSGEFYYFGKEDFQSFYVESIYLYKFNIPRRALFITKISSDELFTLDFNGISLTGLIKEIKFEKGFPICLLSSNLQMVFKNNETKEIQITYFYSKKLQEKIIGNDKQHTYNISYVFDRGYVTKHEYVQ